MKKIIEVYSDKNGKRVFSGFKTMDEAKRWGSHLKVMCPDDSFKIRVIKEYTIDEV